MADRVDQLLIWLWEHWYNPSSIRPDIDLL